MKIRLDGDKKRDYPLTTKGKKSIIQWINYKVMEKRNGR